jgi:putative restriction endonuclease
MRNVILLQRQELTDRHYVLNPDPEDDYWFEFAPGTMADYRKRYGEMFSLIIAGDEEVSNDYYAIPFPEVAHVFSEPFLSVRKNGKPRGWVGSIKNDRLEVRRFPDKLDIRPYKGLPLDGIEASIATSLDLFSNIGRTRDALVSLRVDQSIFRARVMENFGFCCALAGIREEALLVASHIVPWSIRTDIRLDPANGILLFSGYDSLFDKGFISFDDNLQVIVTPLDELYSSELQMLLREVKGRTLSKPRLFPINAEFLRWHRDNKLIKS